MYPKLLKIYGPLELNGFNTAIIVGIIVFMYLANRHPVRAQYISSTAFFNLCIESALAAIVAGRVLHVLSSLSDYPTFYSMISIWDGGGSILGNLFGVIAFSSWRLWQLGVPFAPLADVAALYAPLIQAIGRIGCFLVGCCHGVPTDSFLGITYTDPQVLAPLHVSLHPSQLYSSALLFGLFIALYFATKQYRFQAGTVTLLYLMGMSLERFIVDFTRGDRIMLVSVPHLSFYQLIAAGMFLGALTILVVRHRLVAAHESF